MDNADCRDGHLFDEVFVFSANYSVRNKSETIYSPLIIYPALLYEGVSEVRSQTPSSLMLSYLSLQLDGHSKREKFILERVFNNYPKLQKNAMYLFSKSAKHAFSQSYGYPKCLMTIHRKEDGIAIDTIGDYENSYKMVQFAGFSDDEQHLVFNCDSALYVIETGDGKVMDKTSVIPSSYRNNAYFVSNRYFLFANGDSLLQWYTYNSKKWQHARIPDIIKSIQQANNDEYLVTTRMGVVKINLNNGRITALVSMSYPLHAFYDNDSKRAYIQKRDGSIQVIDINNRKIISTLKFPAVKDSEVPIFSFDMINDHTTTHFFSTEDKNFLVSHSYNDIINIWNLKQNKLQFQSPRLPFVNDIYLLPEKNYLVALQRNSLQMSNRVDYKRVWIFDYRLGKLVFSDSMHIEKLRQNPPSSLANDDDFKRMITPDTPFSASKNKKCKSSA